MYEILIVYFEVDTRDDWWIVTVANVGRKNEMKFSASVLNIMTAVHT